MKTIALQVHDIGETPVDTGWFYVIYTDNDDNLLAIDWQQFYNQHWYWHGQPVNVEHNQMRYWFGSQPITERTNDES